MQPGLRHLGDAGEDVGEPGLGVDIVEPGGADERVHRRRALSSAVGAGEQPGLASQTDAAKRPLRGIVGEADAAVVEESGEAVPALQHVVHRPGYGGMTREPGALRSHPLLKIGDQRGAALPAHREAAGGALAVDRPLDIEQLHQL